MKPKNFPGRKALRQVIVQGILFPYADEVIAKARAIRTKKRRGG